MPFCTIRTEVARLSDDSALINTHRRRAEHPAACHRLQGPRPPPDRQCEAGVRPAAHGVSLSVYDEFHACQECDEITLARQERVKRQEAAQAEATTETDNQPSSPSGEPGQSNTEPEIEVSPAADEPPEPSIAVIVDEQQLSSALDRLVQVAKHTTPPFVTHPGHRRVGHRESAQSTRLSSAAGVRTPLGCRQDRTHRGPIIV
jgi:hypothetical protein